MNNESEPLTPREAAKRLIRVYINRGETEQQLRLSHLGRYGGDFSASIGGSFFNHTEDGKLELVKQFSPRYIGVERVGTQTVHQIFPLKDIIKEIKQENDPKIPRQGRLF